MTNRWYGHKHSLPQTILAAVTAFTLTTLTPANALAFENTIIVSPTFIAPAATRAVRDPYLAEAINHTPPYGYREAGSITATPTPVTTIARWPAALAWSPVKTIFTAATVLPVAAPATPVKPSPTATTTPAAEPAPLHILEGQASFYSRAGCLGCNPLRIMANGQPLNDSALTIAVGANQRHLVGHTARVTSLATGKAVQVRITDTGGFHQARYGHRVADLTIATKQAIGMAGGVGPIRLEIF